MVGYYSYPSKEGRRRRRRPSLHDNRPHRLLLSSSIPFPPVGGSPPRPAAVRVPNPRH